MELDYDRIGMNMHEIRKIGVKNYLGARRRGRRPRPIMVWGPPGVGKTFTVYAMAREISNALGVECEVYANATSCLEPTDLAGVPTPIDVEGITRYTSYLAPRWAYLCSVEYEQDMRKLDPTFVAPPAIIFFDDIPAAHFQTQTAFYKGVHEGHWGDVHARENVMVMAAGNRVEDNAGANDMPTALANRFQHLYARPSTDDWIKWAQHEGKVHPYVVGYIRKCRDDLNEFGTGDNSDVANREEKAFASARTWEMVSDLLHESQFDFHEDATTFFKVVSGLIGQGTATKLCSFLRNTAAVVSPEEICAAPKTAKVPSSKSIDSLFATVASLEHYILENPKNWRAGVIYAVRDEMLPDFGVLLGHTCMVAVMEKLPPKAKTEAMVSEEFVALWERYEGAFELV